MWFLDFVSGMELLGKPAWMWASFLFLVAMLLAADLGLLHRGRPEIGITQSLALSAGYFAVGLTFGGWIWWYMGREPAFLYLTGFLVEKSLSIDNIFIISLIFAQFSIPRAYQHRVLFWGIVGVLVLRGLMIGLGSALIERFEWILYLFAAFLLFTGVKLMFSNAPSHELGKNPFVNAIRRYLPMTPSLHESRFWIRRIDPATGRTRCLATPLLGALVLIEAADLVFAVDSVPAIFAITTDPFLVYTSNIFAILGLRALYIALAAVVERFHYLKYALAAILVFIGLKIFYGEFVGKVDPALSLGFTTVMLAAGISLSMLLTRQPQNADK